MGASCTVSVPSDGVPVQCPVPNCPACPKTRMQMRAHFARRHIADSLTVSEAGTTVHCPECGSFLSSVTKKHLDSKTCALQCKQFVARKHQCEQDFLLADSKFFIDGCPVDVVVCFEHLGRWLSANDTEDKAVSENIKKACATRGHICPLLSRDKACPKTTAHFFKAIV